MSGRPISTEQAEKVAAILREECGRRGNERDVHSFVYHVTRDCREYRFMGALGFGGKFRNNGNHDNTPYVDCYSEDETAERKKMIGRANERLSIIFNS